MNTLNVPRASVETPGAIEQARERIPTKGSPQSDNALFVEIEDTLKRDPRIVSKSTTANVHDGRVTLGGTVQSYSEKLAVCEAVRRMPGVASIDNCLVVELPFATRSTDAKVAADARAALKWEACLPDDAIQVLVEHGCVTLSGEVPWSFQRRLAERAIVPLMGITGIVNALRVSDRQIRMEVIAGIHAALRQAADIEADSIEVVVAESAVTLRGTVSSAAAKKFASDAVRSLDGVHTVRDEIRVSEETAGRTDKHR
jgi:osmotically-inducible protein OsmY